MEQETQSLSQLHERGGECLLVNFLKKPAVPVLVQYLESVCQIEGLDVNQSGLYITVRGKNTT